jgi:hypothetical protein
LVPLYLPPMSINNDDRLWSLWATAGLWVGGGKRAAFSAGHPQDCAQRKGGNQRGASGAPCTPRHAWGTAPGGLVKSESPLHLVIARRAAP